VHSPLIGAQGVATRRARLAWERTHAERRSNHVHSPLIGAHGGRHTGQARSVDAARRAAAAG
jgi:hypothetical protein